MKKSIIIITAILGVLAVGTLLVLGLVDKFCCNVSLTVSDWLSAGCSILSFIGTTALAIVAVWQTEKANKQNELLIEQNKELQRINDEQFKIANQQFFPLLEINNVHLENNDVNDVIQLEKWEKGITNILNEEFRGAFISVDARNYDSTRNLKTSVIFNIINISEAIIKEIEIYKYTCSAPFNNIVDTSWSLQVFTFSKNKAFNLSMDFYHNREIFVKRGDALNFCLFLKIKTITNVTFYEKLHIWASAHYCYGEIEMVSEEEITN